jgi:type VI secretion system protein ImpE
MNPRELYQSGDLTAAIAAAGDEVKRKPGDFAGRYLLCELLCFAGQLERADKQLDLMIEQDPQAALGLALFRQLIRAEQARQQFFDEGRLPEFLATPAGVLQAHLQASIALRAGDKPAAARFIEQGESGRSTICALRCSRS